MKLVGWTSLWAVLMVGVAVAQVDMVGDESEQPSAKEKVEVP